MPLLLAAWSHYVFGIAMFLMAVFLILVILVQRGRGGGLSGALGGMGGQSAFGTKAGDTFTRITMVAAACWVLLCMLSIKMLMPPETIGSDVTAPPSIEGPPPESQEDGAAGGAPESSNGGAGSGGATDATESNNGASDGG